MLFFYIYQILCFNPAIVTPSGTPYTYETNSLLYGYYNPSSNQFVVLQTQPAQNEMTYGTVVYEANPEVSRQVAGTNNQNVYPQRPETDVIALDRKETPVKSKGVEDKGSESKGKEEKKSKDSKKHKSDEDNGSASIAFGCVIGTVIAICMIQ